MPDIRKSIPQYDEKGQLPRGVHKPTLIEFREHFVDAFPASTTRPQIYAGYLDYCMMLYDLQLASRNLVDGSFVTKKLDPNDVDIVITVDINRALSVPADQRSRFVDREEAEEQYHCHAFVVPVYPRGDYRNKFTEEQFAYWMKWFCRDRDNCEKGIIEFDLSLPEHQEYVREEVRRR